MSLFWISCPREGSSRSWVTNPEKASTASSEPSTKSSLPRIDRPTSNDRSRREKFSSRSPRMVAIPASGISSFFIWLLIYSHGPVPDQGAPMPGSGQFCHEACRRLDVLVSHCPPVCGLSPSHPPGIREPVPGSRKSAPLGSGLPAAARRAARQLGPEGLQLRNHPIDLLQRPGPDRDPYLLELGGIDGRGGAGHQIRGAGRLGKGDHLPQRVLARVDR